MPTISDMSDEDTHLLDSLLGRDIPLPEDAVFDVELAPDVLSALELDWAEPEAPAVSEEPYPAPVYTPQVPAPQFAPVLTQDYGPFITPQRWAYFLRNPPVASIFDMLSSCVNMTNTLPVDVDKYLNSRLSFDKRDDKKSGLSLSQKLYVSLVQSIRQTNGDIIDFCDARNTLWPAWMRKRASVFLTQVMYSTVPLPGLPPNGLATLDCSLGFPAKNHVRILGTSEGELTCDIQKPTSDYLSAGIACHEFLLDVGLDLGLEGLPKRFVDRACQHDLNLQFIPIELIYRFFFLDKALPHYTYLYRIDMDGASSSLSSEDQNFLAQYSYYDFVACITFLGSLLLTAAKSFSQMLYEGVQLMLLRAYGTLGILTWQGESGLNLQDTALHTLFLREFHSTDRLVLSDCPGDAYAQQGWEIFKRRPAALFFLSKLTSNALFGEADHNLDSSLYLLNQVIKSVSSRVSKESALSLEQNTYYLKSLPSMYFERGIIAIPSRGYHWAISGKDDLHLDIRHARELALRLNFLFYEEYSRNREGEPKALREWYFLMDLLLLDMSETLSAEIFSERTRKEKYVLNIYGEASRHVNAVSIPKPGEFGIKSYRPEVTGYKNKLVSINIMQYLKRRLTTTINPNMTTVFPAMVVRDMKKDSSITCLKLLKDMRSSGIGLEVSRAREKDLSRQIRVLQDVIASKDAAEASIKDSVVQLNMLVDAQEDLRGFMRDTLVLACRYLVEGFKIFMDIDSLGEHLQPKEDQDELDVFLSSEKSTALFDCWGEHLLFDLSALSRTINLMRYVSSKVFKASTGIPRNAQPMSGLSKRELVALKTSSTRGIELASEPEPKPRGRRPQPLFFALKRRDFDSHVMMLVVYIHEQLYVSFSDGISDVLAELQKSQTKRVSVPRSLVAYPDKVFLFHDIIHFAPYASTITTYVDINMLRGIRSRILSEFPSGNALRHFINQNFCPDWLKALQGEPTPARAVNYLRQLSLIDQDIIMRAHGIERDRVRAMLKKEARDQKNQLKNLTEYKKDILRSLRDPCMGNRQRAYTPNYTAAEDLVIIEKYRPDMTDVQKTALRAACQNRAWTSIRTRAHVLTHKLLNEGVYDINKLPIRYNAKKYLKRLQDNLQMATLDGRIDLQATGETLEKLNERYLTIQTESGIPYLGRSGGVDPLVSIANSQELIDNLNTILDEVGYER